MFGLFGIAGLAGLTAIGTEMTTGAVLAFAGDLLMGIGSTIGLGNQLVQAIKDQKEEEE